MCPQRNTNGSLPSKRRLSVSTKTGEVHVVKGGVDTRFQAAEMIPKLKHPSKTELPELSWTAVM